MSVNDIQHNKEIMEEIQDTIDNRPGDLIVLGGFHGHVGFLGPNELNNNGAIPLELDRNNLVLLNGHADCEGEYTWELRNRRSVINYVMTNQHMQHISIKIHIDEGREIYDLSDHNLITTIFEGNTSH